MTLAAGTLAVTVRLTDGDGDQVTSVAADWAITSISRRRPDGADGDGERGSVTVDETPGVQTAADPIRRMMF